MDFTKLAIFLDSFEKDDPNYDSAQYIKNKISAGLSENEEGIHNADEDHLGDTEITTSTPEQRTKSNAEGKLMDGAFQELDALNKLKEQKEEVTPQKQQTSGSASTTSDFGSNAGNRKEASMYSLLRSKLKK